MTYELAKQLKDAGFQSKRMDQIETYDKGEVIFVPTLSELIEACGNIVLYQEAGQWLCREGEPTKLSEPYVGGGGTPEIAVARLWLALHKETQ